MALTGMLNTGLLARLFQKAEAGDSTARREVQRLGPGFSDSVDVEAKAQPAALDTGSALSSLQEKLPLGRQDLAHYTSSPGQTGDKVSPEEQKPGRKFLGLGGNAWKTIAMGLKGGIDGYLGAQGIRTDPNAGFVGKWRAEQEDALKRRHDMWNTAYESSQTLPMELLQDPKFSTLAQAKVALDKDMQDGKVDNEKNVSQYLTELARFKKDLDEYSVLSKIQLAGKAKQAEQNALIDAGQLANFEGVMVSPEDYARLSQARTGQAQELELANKRLAAQEAETAAQREATAAYRDTTRQDRLDQQDFMRGQKTLQGVSSIVQDSAKQFAQIDPESGRPVITDKSLAQAVMQNKDAILQGAANMGINIQYPNKVQPGADSYVVNGRKFAVGEEPDLLMYLYQMMHSR